MPDNSDKLILSLCDRTGHWPYFYRLAGYRVITVDVQPPPELLPGREHIVGDVRLLKLPAGQVYGILAAPPCTKFASSGARWWEDMSEAELLEALSVVDACLRIVQVCRRRGGLKFWALENPIGRLRDWIDGPVFKFDPCDFGDPYTKKTLLWGEFNMELERHSVEPIHGSKFHTMSNTPDRANLRSVTPLGFAYAFFQANR